MKKGGLLLSDNTVMLFDNMTEEEGMKFLRHILNYHKTGIEPGEDTDRVILLSFKVFKGDYDISQDKYKAKVHRIEEINNRRKASSNDIVTTSHDIVTTSHDIVTTCEKSSPNTYHNNTTHITKEEYKEETTAKPSVSFSPDYSKFLRWLEENCPDLLKMKIPTEDEYNKLLDAADRSKHRLTVKLLEMNNRKDVPKNYRSIYRTCLNWLNRDKK